MTAERKLGARLKSLRAAAALCALVCISLLIPLALRTVFDPAGRSGSVEASARDRLIITSPIYLSESPKIVLERGTLTVLDGANKPAGNVAEQVWAALRAPESNLALDGAALTIETSSGGLAPTNAEAPGTNLARVMSALSDVALKHLAISNTEVTIITSDGSRHAVKVLTGDISRAADGEQRFAAKVAYRSEHIKAEMILAPAPADGSAQPISAQFATDDGTLRFNGRVSKGDRLQITSDNAILDIADIRQTAQWLGLAWPSGKGLGHFVANGPMTIEAGTVSFTGASIAIDNNEATGSITLGLGREKPHIEATLAFKTLDLSPYVASEPTTAFARAADWVAALRIPGYAAPSLIRETDADLRISARSVVLGSARLGRCAASINVRDEKLFADMAELELEQGGTGAGQASIDMSGAIPKLTLEADLKAVDIGRIASAFSMPVVEGFGTLSFGLAAEGTTAVDIARSLGGKATVELADGGRLRLGVAELAPAAKATEPGRGWASVTGSSTTLTSLSAKVSAKDGAVSFDEVNAQSTDHAIAARGAIDMSSKSVDVTLTLTPTPAAATSQSGYRIRGPWASPAVTTAAPLNGKAANGNPRELQTDGKGPG